MVITISTAGGAGEEHDKVISFELCNISIFLEYLYQGKYDINSSFKPQPLLARRSIEQIEEEGGNEELDAQMNNKGISGNIKHYANRAIAATLNCFIHYSILEPDQDDW
ncbi:MAG: hypothetical protein EZS28_052833 [Streblomastix strix]|uniref:Uncharacterized protein n=1 Tax=Streblomastix strix TaxID=222440 RepID=A0A5J4RT77_9EUKA|nr:MAG: hypothetical protein EZS28_052833 [Streblomastix strix]